MKLADSLLGSLGVYGVVRQRYWQVRSPERAREWSRLRSLHVGLFPQGGLVFDVGAFTGERASVCLSLGARVVAFEPNPELASLVRRRYRRGIEVEQCALGEDESEATLLIGRHPEHSALSGSWLAQHAPPEYEGTPLDPSVKWTRRTVNVAVTTLDRMVRRYGLPDYIKIDAESSEPAILRGLSQAVAAVSFEYLCGVPEVVDECFRELRRLGHYEFRLTWAEEPTWLTDWVGEDEARAFVVEVSRRDPLGYGEVFARLSVTQRSPSLSQRL